MALTLKAMQSSDYRTYMEFHEVEYAQDRMITDFETFDEALEKVREQMRATLPQEQNTPDHHLYVVWDGGTQVGYLWFKIKASSRELYLYHIWISPEQRRKGYGRSLLSILDDKAKEFGCRTIWLNVMGHNESAQKLYLGEGYQLAAMHMSKRVSS